MQFWRFYLIGAWMYKFISLEESLSFTDNLIPRFYTKKLKNQRNFTMVQIIHNPQNVELHLDNIKH